MARQVVETLSGSGVIFADGRLLRTTHYRLEIYSEPASDADPASVIEGDIDIAGMPEAVVLAGPEMLTLQIEDGRRLAFTLANTAGRIQARGGLESAPRA